MIDSVLYLKIKKSRERSTLIVVKKTLRSLRQCCHSFIVCLQVLLKLTSRDLQELHILDDGILEQDIRTLRAKMNHVVRWTEDEVDGLPILSDKAGSLT